jgi:hypothetical protein
VLKNLQNGAPFYDNFANIQFLTIDLNRNYKFRNLLSKLIPKTDGKQLEDLVMIALEAQNN